MVPGAELKKLNRKENVLTWSIKWLTEINDSCGGPLKNLIR